VRSFPRHRLEHSTAALDVELIDQLEALGRYPDETSPTAQRPEIARVRERLDRRQRTRDIELPGLSLKWAPPAPIPGHGKRDLEPQSEPSGRAEEASGTWLVRALRA